MKRNRPKKKPRFLPLERDCKKRGCFVIAGLDEAGRGPWAGPLVCAAVILKPRTRLLGLNDAKLITPKLREILSEKIKTKCDYGIGVVSHKVIDRFGLIKACERAFLKAVSNLSQKPDVLLVDGSDRFQFPYAFQSIIRGDRKVRSIAAASVLAKVHRDKLMVRVSRKFPNFSFHIHKGYGTRLHQKLLKTFGPSKIHRLSFRPVKAMVKA